MQATARILVRRGWDGLTTNHVAALAGVSVGTLYEYFPGKHALVRALVDRHLDGAEAMLRDRVAAVLGPGELRDATTLVRTVVDAMIELHADDPRLHRVLFEEVPHDRTVRERVRRMEESAVAALTAVLPRVGGVTVRDPAIAARLIVDLLESLTHRWTTGPDAAPIPKQRLADELTRMIVAYLERQ